MSDELRGVELGDDTLEDLVTDRRQHLLVVVQSQLAVHGRQARCVGSGQDAQGNVDHLKILRASRRRDLSWARADIVDDWVLEPGQAEVKSLRVCLALNSRQAAEDDSAVTALD